MVLGTILKKELFFESCSSTNDVIKEFIDKESEKNTNPGIFATTNYQTAGRGHGENRWYSSYGKNILLSIHCRPVNISPEYQYDISRIAALAISDLLKSLVPENHIVKVKWPNDIFVDNYKIAGILIENRIMGDNIIDSIIGIGLNVNELYFPESISGAISLNKIIGGNIELDVLLRKLILSFDQRNNKNYPYNHKSLHSEFDQSLYGINRTMLFSAGDTQFEGIITGTDCIGLLQINTKSGIEKFGFKEVALVS